MASDIEPLWRKFVQTQMGFGARVAGSEGGKKSEDWLAQSLTEWGFDVVKTPVSVTDWSPGTSRVNDMEGFPIPFCANQEEAVEAPLMWMDHSSVLTRPSCEGKIVVGEIRFPTLRGRDLKKVSLGVKDDGQRLDDFEHPATWVRIGWHLYRYAAQHGAKGFVGILTDQPGPSAGMYAPYGFRETDILDKPIPGMWLHKSHLQQIKDLCKTRSNVTYSVTSIKKPSVSHNIIGTLPGESKESLVIGCHHDSPFVSPVEDASGVAVVLQTAKDFAESKTLKKTLRVCFTAGHFYGSIGTKTLIKSSPELFGQEASLAYWVEHLAKEAKENEEGELVSTGHDEPLGVFLSLNKELFRIVRDAAEKSELDGSMFLPAESPFGDFPPTDGGDIHLTGTPLVNVISNPVYLLTDQDCQEGWVSDTRMKQAIEFSKNLLVGADRFSRRELTQKGYWKTRCLMRGLRYAKKGITTWGGLRPVH